MKRWRRVAMTQADFRRFKQTLERAKAEEQLRLAVDGGKRKSGPRTDTTQEPRRLPKAMRRGYRLRLASIRRQVSRQEVHVEC